MSDPALTEGPGSGPGSQSKMPLLQGCWSLRLARCNPLKEWQCIPHVRTIQSLPSMSANHWDRLPTHLQGHIRAIAAELAAREQHPKLTSSIPAAALRMSIKRWARKALAYHKARMTCLAWRAAYEAARKQHTSTQHICSRMEAATSAVVRATAEEARAAAAMFEAYSAALAAGTDSEAVRQLWKITDGLSSLF